MDAKMDLRQLQWVLEQVNASKNPVPAERILATCRNPNGPYLPDGMVSSMSLPDEPAKPLAIEAGANGEPWLLYPPTERTGPYRLWNPQRKGILPVPQPKDVHGWKGGSIIGFGANGEPAIEIDYTTNGGIDMTAIFIGAKQVERVRTCGYASLWTVCPDGRLLCAAIRKLGDGFHAPQDVTVFFIDPLGGSDEVVGVLRKRKDHPVGLALTASGTVALLMRADRESRIVRFPSEAGGAASQIEDGANIRLPISGSPFLCIDPLFGSVRLLYGWIPGDRSSGPDAGISCENRFRRNLQMLPDDRIVYVGETVRHEFECWVVHGREQPGFEAVTNLFREEGRLFYYGLIGQHLCKMRLPDPLA